MSDIADRVKEDLVDRDPGDETEPIRERLVPDLKPGERIVNGRRVYSAQWLDDDGKYHDIGLIS